MSEKTVNKKIHIFVFLVMIFLSSAVAFSQEKDRYILGIPPWGGKEDDIKERFVGFATYLEENLGKKVEFRVSADYDQLGEDVYSGKVDIAIISSFAYVRTREKYPNMRYLCTALDKKSKKATYSSYIIAGKEKGISTVKDLKNKLFAFVDESSASGYKFPLAMMMTKWKVDPDTYFKKVMFLGTHPNVYEAVRTGQADAGALSAEYVDKINENDTFVVIDKIDNIPYDGVVVSPKMNEETYLKVKKLFLAINENTMTKDNIYVTDKFPWAGFAEKSDKFYDVIKDTDDTINLYMKKKSDK